MVVTPELIKKWKAERRANEAAKRATKMAAMKELMKGARKWLRTESLGAMDKVLAALDRGEFDEKVKDAVLRGHGACAVLDVSKMFSNLTNSPWGCQHRFAEEAHLFGTGNCEQCHSLFERELRSVLAEVSKSRGLKFKLPRLGPYVVLSL